MGEEENDLVETDIVKRLILVDTSTVKRLIWWTQA